MIKIIKITIAAFFVLPSIINVYAQAWLDIDWTYRREITITNPSSTELTDFPVQITLDASFTFANANSDGSDIRVADADTVSLLSYWIEDWNPGATRAVIWVKVPVIAASGTATIFLYYGNVAATSVASGYNTFHAFDGFESYELGTVPSSNNNNPGEWTRYPGNPLIVPGPSGSWDAAGATFASVILDTAAGEYRMYYHGYTGSTHQVGLATSPDGLTWTKYAGNPILPPGSPGSWDGSATRVPMVWKEGPNDYRMIYTGAGTASGQIGYATSSDGINWTKYAGNPVFNDPTWAHNQTENWGVIKVDTLYLMWYSTWGTRQSGIAISTDLINWTPYQSTPIFATNGIPTDDRYSQFCPYTFKYGAYYYVLVPSYSSIGDYSKFYVYRSSSPYFPESDRHLVRVAHTSKSGDIDALDNDTPFIFTLDIERSIFPNDELRCYYAAEPGSGWREGLLIETDIAAALSDTTLPGGNLTWSNSGTVSVVNTTVRQGNNSVSLTNAASLSGTFSSLPQGIVGAWMNRASTSAADEDIYLYGGASLSCVAGLGRNGVFHYWNGAFANTAVSWSTNTWYLVTIEFTCASSQYNFVVYDQSFNEIVRVNGIGFGNASSAIDRGMMYTSSAYVGTAYADDYRVRQWIGSNPGIAVGTEETNPLPVELSQFTASVNGRTVLLAWRTETEVNNYGFEIQKREKSQLEWETIGFVNGNGNSNSPKDYSFEDDQPGSGSFLYRLRQIDNDGSFYFTGVVSVNINLPAVYSLSQNFPNPFNPSTTIEYQVKTTGIVKLTIFDVLGREVKQLVNEEKSGGNYRVTWNGNDSRGKKVSSGIYIYRLEVREGNGAVYSDSKKLIILK